MSIRYARWWVICGFLSAFGSALYPLFNPQIRILPVAHKATATEQMNVLLHYSLRCLTMVNASWQWQKNIYRRPSFCWLTPLTLEWRDRPIFLNTLSEGSHEAATNNRQDTGKGNYCCGSTALMFACDELTASLWRVDCVTSRPGDELTMWRVDWQPNLFTHIIIIYLNS